MNNEFPNYDQYNQKIDLVIYHKNCADGFGAAFSAWKKLNSIAVYIACSYNDNPPVVVDKHVAVFDFSFPRDITIKLQSEAASFILLDHHKTAKESISDLPNCYFNMNKSGAVLAWEFFHPDQPIPKFLLHIQDRDIWKFEMQDTYAFSESQFLRPYQFDSWNEMMNEQVVIDMIEKGKYLLEMKENNVKYLVKSADKRKFQGYDTYCVNSYNFLSEVGNNLCEKYPDAVALIWRWNTKYKCYYISLRSYQPKHEGDKCGPDVSMLAKKYEGGGGHEHASGFTYRSEYNIESLFDKNDVVVSER